MMNNNILKLLSILAIIIFIAIIPIQALATGTNVSLESTINKDVSIVSTTNEKDEQEYMIYIKNYSDTEFKYALSNNAKPEIMDLYYINSISDLGENQVAFLDANTYASLPEGSIYMWAKNQNENLILNGVQLDFQKSITKEKIDLVESTTKRISVEVANTKDATQTVRNENIDGVDETAAVGYVEIKDDQNATYYYERTKLPNSEQHNKLMELAEKIEKEYSKMDMYAKIQIATEFYDIYTALIENNEQWAKIENMKIEQPENSVKGDQYILFLKKVSGETITIDAQFLTADDDYKPNVIKEQIITQETARLPITYDSIALIVILAVIVIALIVIFIRMKKLSKNEEK